MRPVFHWILLRIKAHIAVCFMALVSVWVMEYKQGYNIKTKASG